ncbi:MAG: 6-phosphogluconolactonase [Sulfurospirillaceae bacterium]|nr:6-phosphogluconolactonase [Sulfurospirillaceae bacterium]
MMSRIVYKYNDKDMLIEDLSNNIARDLKDAIKRNGQATLMVSGGNTPKPLFEILSRANILWEKVTIGLCDERWVNPTHKDSNEKMVREYLLKHKAKTAKFIGMYEDIPINEAVDLCSQKIKAELFPFDVIILGLGSDAHTASLFPNNEKLRDAYTQNLENLCIAIKPQTAPHLRMSLTKLAILSAKNIYLHFEGKTKTAVFQKALSTNDEYNMPILAILNQEEKDIKVYYCE